MKIILQNPKGDIFGWYCTYYILVTQFNKKLFYLDVQFDDEDLRHASAEMSLPIDESMDLEFGNDSIDAHLVDTPLLQTNKTISSNLKNKPGNMLISLYILYIFFSRLQFVFIFSFDLHRIIANVEIFYILQKITILNNLLSESC